MNTTQSRVSSLTSTTLTKWMEEKDLFVAWLGANVKLQRQGIEQAARIEKS